MCTHARIPSPSRRNESASSKSFAVSGSIVKVVRARRSTRPSSDGSGGVCGSNSPREPCSTSSASSTFSIRRADPSARSTRARPRPVRATARSPSSRSPRPFDSRTSGTPGAKNGSPTTSRPRRATSTTTRSTGGAYGRRSAAREQGESGVEWPLRAHVRDDATRRDVATRRSSVRGDGQLERAARRKPVDLLHERLAEGRLPDNERATVVAERGGDDLGGTRAAAVDEHDDGKTGFRARASVDERLRAVRAGERDHRPPLLQEQRRDVDGLSEEPARISAQVDGEPARTLRLEAADGRAHGLRGAESEALDADRADAPVEHARRHRRAAEPL